MNIKIDWLSWTIKVMRHDDLPAHLALKFVLGELYDFAPDTFETITAGYSWEPRKGRAPYSVGWERSDHGCYLFYSPVVEHVLIEITGRGCDAIEAAGATRQVLGDVDHRLTRLDLACDMECDTDPLAFVALRAEGRFKSHSEVVSASGTTAYVGSRTSNKYARVYRYNPPHERAHLLRCEYSIKAEDAKLAAKYIQRENATHLAVELGAKFGWQHPAWNPFEIEVAPFKAWTPERGEGKTLFWLNDTVAKTLIRLHKQGVIDATAWLHDNVTVHLDNGLPF